MVQIKIYLDIYYHDKILNNITANKQTNNVITYTFFFFFWGNSYTFLVTINKIVIDKFPFLERKMIIYYTNFNGFIDKLFIDI